MSDPFDIYHFFAVLNQLPQQLYFFRGPDDGGTIRIEIHSEKEKLKNPPKLQLPLKEIGSCCLQLGEPVSIERELRVKGKDSLFAEGIRIELVVTKLREPAFIGEFQGCVTCRCFCFQLRLMSNPMDFCNSIQLKRKPQERKRLKT